LPALYRSFINISCDNNNFPRTCSLVAADIVLNPF
jgi:hypothetical protein